MKLYRHPLSGHSHRAQLFLSLLGVPHELIDVDLKARAHKAPEFLALNPFGQVPVLDDEGTVIADSNAILVYLAKKLGRIDWLPEDPAAAATESHFCTFAAAAGSSGSQSMRPSFLAR